ncbi:porin family protein [Bacteroides ilei]|jgi:hypothetical protein|uniref:porin family protein n=1 Tax=Bacteroides ilei TaxID=1907658 RepID=UPI0009315B84|nr:porin family protein [Bacteroides ilei]
MKKILTTMLLMLALTSSIQAQQQHSTLKRTQSNGWEFALKAGFNIGGFSPIPLPVEIRSIEGYNPTLAIQLGGEMTKWIGSSPQWGITLGLRFENKNMTTKAMVKNYSMEIIGSDGNRLKGNWTGGVKTDVRNDYLSIPLLASWKPSSRWTVQFGPYASILLNGNFTGNVYEGYLREGDPTGEKINFSEGAVATYDFSDNLRTFQWGLQAGGEWKAFRHLKVYSYLTWGLNDIFNKDFQTITFEMYPIYLNFGFGYSF